MASSSTKYAQIGTNLKLSRNSNYANPIHGGPMELTDEFEFTRQMIGVELLAATGGETLDLTTFGTIEDIIVTNLDTTNRVDITYTDAAATAGSTTRVKAGRTVRMGAGISPTAAFTLTANTADCECIVTVLGTA